MSENNSSIPDREAAIRNRHVTETGEPCSNQFKDCEQCFLLSRLDEVRGDLKAANGEIETLGDIIAANANAASRRLAEVERERDTATLDRELQGDDYKNVLIDLATLREERDALKELATTEIKRLTKINTQNMEDWRGLRAENTALRARVERLQEVTKRLVNQVLMEIGDTINERNSVVITIRAVEAALREGSET